MASRGLENARLTNDTGQLDTMKDRTNQEPLDPMPGELPATARRSGLTPAQHGGKPRAALVDPDALFEQVLDGANLGWMNYFGISHTYREVLELDEWMRRRVRLYHWTAQRDSPLK